MNAITIVTKLLGSGAIWASEPFHQGPLSLIPLFHDSPQSEYVRFGELSDGSVAVTEVDAAGHVPELLVTNSASRPVLFLEGEVLVGLKQDRTLNVTVLVPAHSKMHLPVACVEQGRWGQTTTVAGRGDFSLPPSARYHKSESTQRSARTTGAFRADQGAVWDSVDMELRERGIHSASSAFRDVAAAPPDTRFGLILDLEPRPNQRGVLRRHRRASGRRRPLRPTGHSRRRLAGTHPVVCVGRQADGSDRMPGRQRRGYPATGQPHSRAGIRARRRRSRLDRAALHPRCDRFSTRRR